MGFLRESPSMIAIQPPEKLALEIRASGGYSFIQWKRNSITHGLPGFTSPESFTHFGEIYVVANTTVNDLGTYLVLLGPGIGQRRPDPIIFTVKFQTGKACN